MKIYILLLLIFTTSIIGAQPTEELQKLIGHDADTGSYFGVDVSISGDYAIVGASGEKNYSVRTGVAYIYKNLNNSWELQNKITASDAEFRDWFGESVCISGNYAIVGACGNDDGAYQTGSAYIFRNNNGIWEQQVKLLAFDGKEYDHFGRKVAIYDDYAVVAATDDEDDGYNGGIVYIYKNNGGNWDFHQKLDAADGADYFHFGTSVDISETYLLIGTVANVDEQRAYMYKNVNGIWQLDDILIPADGEINEGFAKSVHIDGDYAIIGSPFDRDNEALSGSAYIFKLVGNDWQEEQKLLAFDGVINDLFGYSVSISGNYALIGARQDNINDINSGSAYLFENNGSNWVFHSKQYASDGELRDYFGKVDIDGNYSIIGAWHNSNEKGIEAGAAYIFGPLPTAIQQFDIENNISAYPNPTTAISIIKLTVEHDAKVKMITYNALGIVVQKSKIISLTKGKHQLPWDGNKLPKGNYFIRIQSNSGSSTIKIMKQ